MGLADDLAAHAPHVRCDIGTILATVDAKTKAALEAALATPHKQWPHTELADTLRANGHKASEYSVGKHRSGRCGCAR